MTPTLTKDASWVDYHCHCLPDIDYDGTTNCDETAQMILELANQGVFKIYATPHFSLSNETVGAFIARRAKAYQLLRAHPMSYKFPQIILSAEINVQRGLSEVDLSPILSGSRIALFEFPYYQYKHWMVDEIENVAYRYDIVPVIAHVERYFMMDQVIIDDLLSLQDVILQVNCNAFNNSDTLNYLKKITKHDWNFVFGSDAHNMSLRKPNFSVLNTLHARRNLFFKPKMKKAVHILRKINNFQDYIESVHI